MLEYLQILRHHMQDQLSVTCVTTSTYPVLLENYPQATSDYAMQVTGATKRELFPAEAHVVPAGGLKEKQVGK